VVVWWGVVCVVCGVVVRVRVKFTCVRSVCVCVVCVVKLVVIRFSVFFFSGCVCVVWGGGGLFRWSVSSHTF
jgi:hypothetical protein